MTEEKENCGFPENYKGDFYGRADRKINEDGIFHGTSIQNTSWSSRRRPLSSQ